ncbi:PEP-CTERM sorting domain-containing protein [Methylomonas subterranea]|uniref:PEP-CTERM sorting domain-containing protein n=1 Tax=Methylomonas subterranea TaxID=2952225 RepID=UPI003531928C
MGFVSPDAESIDVNFYNTQVNVSTATTVPVPATMWLFGTGLFAISALTKKIRSYAKQTNG